MLKTPRADVSVNCPSSAQAFPVVSAKVPDTWYGHLGTATPAQLPNAYSWVTLVNAMRNRRTSQLSPAQILDLQNPCAMGNGGCLKPLSLGGICYITTIRTESIHIHRYSICVRHMCIDIKVSHNLKKCFLGNPHIAILTLVSPAWR